MSLHPKVVLHLPLSDKDALPAFVDDCLTRNVSLIAIVGENATEVEELIDWLIIGDDSDKNRFITTSSHVDASLEDVVELARLWSGDGDGPVEIVRL